LGRDSRESARAHTGRFTDPGADTFTATVDYGDGFAPQPLPIQPG
jgi:hypothetical protein